MTKFEAAVYLWQDPATGQEAGRRCVGCGKPSVGMHRKRERPHRYRCMDCFIDNGDLIELLDAIVVGEG